MTADEDMGDSDNADDLSDLGVADCETDAEDAADRQPLVALNSDMLAQHTLNQSTLVDKTAAGIVC